MRLDAEKILREIIMLKTEKSAWQSPGNTPAHVGDLTAAVEAICEEINAQAEPSGAVATLHFGPLSGTVKRPEGDPKFIDLPSFGTSARAFRFRKSADTFTYHFHSIIPYTYEAEPEPNVVFVGDRVRAELVGTITDLGKTTVSIQLAAGGCVHRVPLRIVSVEPQP